MRAILLLALTILASGCTVRSPGWSRFRYEWWSTFSQKRVQETFGPFQLSECVELHKPGWSADGVFLPRSPDGYNLLLCGYVLDDAGNWKEDIVMPWGVNSLRDLLYKSQAELEIRVASKERDAVCCRIALADAMKQRSRFFDGAVVVNYYPLLRIETSSIPASTPVSVSVSVVRPDAAFSKYNGRIALQIRGHVESW